MSTSLSFDAKFVQLATPVLSEFGFSGIKELVSEQLTLMLQTKIDQYDAEDRLFASKFGKPFETITAQSRQEGAEDFDLDDALNDWRFARESAALYRVRMQELNNA